LEFSKKFLYGCAVAKKEMQTERTRHHSKEVEQITDDTYIEDETDEFKKKAIVEEWEAHMTDFMPHDMLTIELQPRKELSVH
jgi:hypothetical protein